MENLEKNQWGVTCKLYHFIFKFIKNRFHQWCFAENFSKIFKQLFCSILVNSSFGNSAFFSQILAFAERAWHFLLLNFFDTRIYYEIFFIHGLVDLNRKGTRQYSNQLSFSTTTLCKVRSHVLHSSYPDHKLLQFEKTRNCDTR